MMLRPPRSTPLPYTTLFRSGPQERRRRAGVVGDELGRGEDDEIDFRLGERPREDCRPVRFAADPRDQPARSEEHTAELQSRQYLACRLLLEKKSRSKLLFHS